VAAHPEFVGERQRLLEGLARCGQIGPGAGRRATFAENPQCLGFIPALPVALRQLERFRCSFARIVGPAAEEVARGEEPAVSGDRSVAARTRGNKAYVLGEPARSG
jgi:hypothetical protein